MIVVVAGCLLVAGCAQTPPSNFYTLSSLRSDDDRGNGADPDGLTVALGPIALPQYLDRPQIVTRTSPNRLQLAEFDRWAEPFQEIFTRVLAENLSLLLDTDHIITLPTRRSRMTDYRVEVEVLRFDTEVSGRTQLATRWSIYGLDDEEPLVVRRTVHESSVSNANDFESIAAAMSRCLADLSREIAKTVSTMSA